MVDVKYCGSIRTLDGWTLKPLGWMYGIHILADGSGPGLCPVCGLGVGHGKVEELDLQSELK